MVTKTIGHRWPLDSCQSIIDIKWMLFILNRVAFPVSDDVSVSWVYSNW